MRGGVSLHVAAEIAFTQTHQKYLYTGGTAWVRWSAAAALALAVQAAIRSDTFLQPPPTELTCVRVVHLRWQRKKIEGRATECTSLDMVG